MVVVVVGGVDEVERVVVGIVVVVGLGVVVVVVVVVLVVVGVVDLVVVAGVELWAEQRGTVCFAVAVDQAMYPAVDVGEVGMLVFP